MEITAFPNCIYFVKKVEIFLLFYLMQVFGGMADKRTVYGLGDFVNSGYLVNHSFGSLRGRPSGI